MSQVNFNTTKTESELIMRIVDRAITDFSEYFSIEEMLDRVMDLAACHCNGTALDLEKLLGADDFNFIHDLGGIRKNMDRNTGKLKNFFVPRCAMPPRTESRKRSAG